MMPAALAGPSGWRLLPELALCLAAGLGAGVLYFRSLFWSVQRFAHGGRATPAIALGLLRFALLGGLLALAATQGALPLLAAALGVLIARALVARRVRRSVP